MPHLLQLRRGLGRRLGAEAREIRTEIRDVETRIYTVDGSTDDEIAEARADLSARIDRLTSAQSGRDFTGEAALWFIGGALFMLLVVVTVREFMTSRPRRSSMPTGERTKETHREDRELTSVP